MSHDTGTPFEMSISDMESFEEPFSLFDRWFEAASQEELNDPNAMALATVDKQGLPNVRMVLLKGIERRGFVFFTNYESNKGQEILSSGKAALCFHWKSLRRQVRLRGIIEQVSEAEADDYYHSRPRGSQIGAWASQQSRPLEDRAVLEQRVSDVERRFANHERIPRPPHWSGFRLLPLSVEFWHDRPFRLHDRIVFSRAHSEDSWKKTRLYP